MLLEGKFAVQAPIQKLWDLLLDPAILFSCIPGAEKVERLDDKTFEAIIVQKVGPIAARVQFKIVATKMVPPTRMEFQGEGEETHKAGHFVLKAVVDLAEGPGGKVDIAYKCDMTVTGRMAVFGDRIMRAKAASMQEELTKNLSAKLKGLT